ncbi:hypothetical protein [Methanocorpusculum vombati]|uniref:Resolvase HTH domain-containing protein n=1 Tax=Methanocorpusculum vombati TaxID=3002864 RepID=A0ABT4IP68_9EURY|nr:hypothetical protein [Methanocorpusculum vombati]MCZ0863556.1 hypothetical protein [Methanocorpusculum vombati]
MVWRDHAPLRDRDHLRKQLLAGKTIEQIARENHCTRETVKAAMHHHQIRRPLIRIPKEMEQKLRL